MGNLSGGLSKFLSNKNTVTIFGVILCLVILYVGYVTRINKKTELVDVFYAKETIEPKTLITEDMIARASVPKSFILGNYKKDYTEIVGKYSNYNAIIPEGSIFYDELVIDEENLPDAIFYNVNEGERVVSFPVTTESTYGNSIMPGNLVDVYIKMINKDNKIIYGQFVKNTEILGVKDSAGKNVFESSEDERTPAYAYFSLEEAKYLLFSAMTYIQKEFSNYEIEMVLVPNTVKYTDEDPTAVQVSSKTFYEFALDNLKEIDDQKELYNKLINEMEQQALEEKEKQKETAE